LLLPLASQSSCASLALALNFSSRWNRSRAAFFPGVEQSTAVTPPIVVRLLR
jgi:hypothetical protein